LAVLPVSTKIYVCGILTYRVALLSMKCFLAVVVLTHQILICQQNHLSVRLAHVVKVSNIQYCPMRTYFECNDSVYNC